MAKAQPRQRRHRALLCSKEKRFSPSFLIIRVFNLLAGTLCISLHLVMSTKPAPGTSDKITLLLNWRAHSAGEDLTFFC